MQSFVLTSIRLPANEHWDCSAVRSDAKFSKIKITHHLAIICLPTNEHWDWSVVRSDVEFSKIKITHLVIICIKRFLFFKLLFIYIYCFRFFFIFMHTCVKIKDICVNSQVPLKY